VTTVLGVDGARGGWVGALLPCSRGTLRTAEVTPTWLRLRTIGEALALDVAVVGVDMPVGLPARGRRECDLLAKQVLGRAHPRVFLAPPRAVLTATTYDDAAARHRAQVGGRGLSVQTWHIVPKIREVDDVADDPRLVEVHPEVSFARMTGQVLPSKHSAIGRSARLAAVSTCWPEIETVPHGDDGLDALAAAWSARRWWLGQAETLPPGPPRDERGRPMRIVV
jgi:predicted RNase H-like nuclease